MALTSLKELSKVIGRIPNDIEFAGIVALTRTAKLIQAVVKATAKAKFNLKNTWVLRGIRITPATKQKIEAQVFTLDKFLQIQDVGGKRKTDSKTKQFLIPGRQFKSKTGINPREKVIPKRFRLNLLLNKTTFKIDKKTKKAKNRARAFETTAKSGAILIAVRDTSERSPLSVLYVIVRHAINIRKRLFFEIPAGKTYDEEFENEYDKTFDQFVKVR